MYIAHFRKGDKAIQTVDRHCEDTAKLAEEFACGLGIKSIVRTAGLLHDAGKMNGDFAGYIMGENNIRRGQIDHSYAGAKYIMEMAEGIAANTEDEDSRDNIRRTAGFIARVIAAHHGLQDWIDCEHRDRLKYRTEKTERYEEICEGVKNFISGSETESLLLGAAAEYKAVSGKLMRLCERDGKKYKEEYFFYRGMFERLAESVLVDADRTDTAAFTDGRTVRGEDNAGVWEECALRLDAMFGEFGKKTDEISKYRMDISDRCAEFAERERGICRLVVPTGGGKTVSSMRFAVEYCRRFGKKRIFYIAPFMSILEQNGKVLREIAGEENFLEHHSDFAARIDDADELEEYELRCENWADPVVAATAVQFLDTLFSGKMSCVRRFHRLAGAVIIIDEIQSLPIKCVHIFNLALNFLSRVCGAVTVLCSATQPPLRALRHPLLTDEVESMTGDYTEDFTKFKRTEMISDIRIQQYTFEEAAEYAYEKFCRSNDLLMILNTKKAAAEIFRLLGERLKERGDEAVTVHLSTMMCPKHRRDTLDRVRRLLADKKPVICVTTQLIEAGVDISFGCVIRSAAGLDSAAQAAGRCNRHGERGICPVYVINIKDENLGNLGQIRAGRDIFESMAYSGKYDLLSNETMEEYFGRLYGRYEKMLDYPVSDRGVNTTLLNLLSLNKERGRMCRDRPDDGQAFMTAGSVFKVIDGNTRDVIVPYDKDAEDIIAGLNSDIGAGEALRLLRQAQKYCVGLYPDNFDRLLGEGRVHCLRSGGIYALDKSCFSKETGIDLQGGEREVLIL